MANLATVPARSLNAGKLNFFLLQKLLNIFLYVRTGSIKQYKGRCCSDITGFCKQPLVKCKTTVRLITYTTNPA